MKSEYLVRVICKLAAELADELERIDPESWRIEIDLRVRTYEPVDPGHGLFTETERMRRTSINGGEWSTTERRTVEKWA